MFSAFIFREVSAKVTTPSKGGASAWAPAALVAVGGHSDETSARAALRGDLEPPWAGSPRSLTRPQQGALFCCFTAQNMYEWNVFLRE